MPSAHPSTGFQAVILCGPGSSLYPFTGAEDLPKALLQIANKPMLHYPLEWCEKAGFDSILVLALAEHHALIQSYVRLHRVQKSSLYIFVEAASSLNDNLGTADVLRVAYKKGWLNSDFVVVPCDLVTNLDGKRMVELWMVMQAGFDGDLGRRSRKYQNSRDTEDGRRGGLAVYYETLGEGAVKGQETDFVAITPVATSSAVGCGLPGGHLGVLLSMAPTQALKGLSELPIHHRMMRKYPDIELFSTYRDAGIYFFPHWVLKFIERNHRMSSIREDIIPWLAKARWQKSNLAKSLGLLEILTPADTHVSGDNESDEGITQEYDLGSMSTTRVRRSPNSSSKECFKIPSMVTYLSQSPVVFMRRVDTVHLFLYTSLHLAKTDRSNPSPPIKIDQTATIGEKAIVTGMDCLVADKVSIGARAVVKKSVLGSGVSIGRGARLMGCVVMDGASVGDNVKLEGCTVGRKATIGAKSVLKDCEVAGNFIIEDGTEAKNEQFVAFTGLEPESDDYETDDGDAGSEDILKGQVASDHQPLLSEDD